NRGPSGDLGDTSGGCNWTPERIERYRGLSTGPRLDRSDMHLQVTPVEHEVLLESAHRAENSASIRARVRAARQRAEARGHAYNAGLRVREIDRHCPLADDARRVIEQAMLRLNLSARAYHRIVRVARSIADLAASETIAAQHVAEAIGVRQVDRG